jgi:hypothetical protein
MKPGAPTLQTTPANMTMTQGPMPATSAISTAEPVKADIMGPGKGPAPKVAMYTRPKKMDTELPDPPSLKPAKPPEPPTAFKPKTRGEFMRAGASQGTT